MSASNLTTTLTLLIMAGDGCHADLYEHHIYEVLDRLMDLSGWSDARRADLYALLVESLVHKEPMTVMERKVAAALAKNEDHFRA